MRIVLGLALVVLLCALPAPVAAGASVRGPVDGPSPADALTWWGMEHTPRHRALPPTEGSPRRAPAGVPGTAPWSEGPFTPSDAPGPAGTLVAQVIVTSEALAEAFGRLADDETGRGVPTVVRTVPWIDARYPGADAPARIRAFLRDAFDAWGTRFAILGGDLEHVPVRTVDWAGESIPTDLYYECLDREWNEDGDAAYGEPVGAAVFDGLVNDVARAADGRIWAATYFGVAADDGAGYETWTEADGLPSNEVLCVDAAADGAVWAGTALGAARFDGDGWTAWTVADGIPDARVLCVDAGAADDAWVGTSLGLAHWDGEAWRTFGVADGLPHPAVTALARDGDALWVATLGGVARFAAGSLASWTVADGLLSNWAFAVGVDPQGVVWVGHPHNFFSQGGVSRLAQGAWSAEPLGATGLTVRGFAFGPAAGEAWAVTSAGLVHFDDSGHDVLDEPSGLPGDLFAIASGSAELLVATAEGVARGWPGEWTVRGVSHGLPVAPRDYDDVDLVGDLLVGRIPATDAAEADAYTAKLARYRRGTGVDHAERALILGENLFVAGDGKQLGESASARFPAGYARTTRYEADGNLNRASALAALNAGPGWVVYISHGSYDVLGAGPATDLLFNRDLDSLDSGGRPAFVTVYACNSGGFDFDSSAEHLLFHPTGGAIATLSHTREAVPSSSDHDLILERLFGAAGGSAARAVQLAREEMWNEDADALRTATWQRRASLTRSYLGAPDLPLWRAQPRTPVVACPAEVPLGRTPLVVTVTDEGTGSPVEGARVCVTKAGEVWALATTDATGEATLIVRPSSPGTLDVAVSADGYALRERAVTAVAPTAPLAVADGVEVLALRTSGEAAEMDLMLRVRNAGLDAPAGWTVAVESLEPAVHVVEGSGALPALAAGESAAAGPFRVRAHRSLDPGAPFHLRLRGTGSPPFAETYRVTMHGGAVRVAGLALDGDTVRPILENPGAGETGPLQLRLEASGGGVVLLPATAIAPSLAPGERRTVDAGLRVSGPASASFTLHVRDARGRELRHPFDRVRPDAPAQAAHQPLDGAALVTWSPAVAPDVAGYRVLVDAGGVWTEAPSSPVTGARIELPVAPGGSARLAILSRDRGGVESADTCRVTVHAAPPTVPGWPRRLPSLVGPAPLMVSDLDGDGTREILLGSMWEANCVSVFRADGTEWVDGDGRPHTTGPFGITGARVHAAPLAHDIDGDGNREIFTVSFDGKAYAWRTDGAGGPPAPLPGWPVTLTPQGARSAPAAADVDGDGAAEIVTVALDGKVRVLEADGTMAAGWPKTTRASGTGTTPAVFDFDADGREDLAFGGTDSLLYVVSGDGTDFPGWPVAVGAKILSCPVLADIDADGEPEVFAMARDGRVFGFRIRDTDGAGGPDPLPGWPVLLEPYLNSPPSPALADFDGDGVPELVLPGKRTLAILRADGTAFPGWAGALPADLTCSPVVADLDGDGSLDVLVGTEDRRLHALRIDGAPLPGWPREFRERPWSTPYVADVDGDGDLDVAIASDDMDVRVVDVAGPDVPGAAPWPGYHGGASRGVWVPAPAAVFRDVALRAARAVPDFTWSGPVPSPFRDATAVAFALPHPTPTRLEVFDVSGRRVATLVDRILPAGRHAATWDGRDASGRRTATGMYFLRLVAGGEVRNARVLHLR